MPVEMAPPIYGNLPQIQNPQSENFLQTAQQAQQLRLGQQQQQSQALSIQQQQMDMQDQHNMRRAWMDSGGDLDKMQTLARRYGVGPKTQMAMNQSIVAQKTAIQALTKDQLANITEKNNMVRPVIDGILAEKDDANLPGKWADGEQALISRGILKPGEAQPYPGSREGIQSYANSLVAHDQLTKDATAGAAVVRSAAMASQADTAKTRETAELPGQQAASQMTARKNVAAQLAAAPDAATYDQTRDSSNMAAQFPPSRLVFDAGGKWMPGQQTAVQRVGMTPEERTQADQAAANAAQNALPKTEPELSLIVNDPAKPQALRDAAKGALQTMVTQHNAERPVTLQTTTPGLGGGADNSKLTGEDYLNSLPVGTAAQIRAIAEGRAVMPSAATRSQAAIQLRNGVFQFDPTYNDQRAQVRKAFTTGPDGRNIGALNTAAVHLDQFADAATAMNNGTFTPGNAAWNSLRSSFGATAPTNFAALKTAVAGELASALKGNATDPEIANVSKAIDAANSPAQLSGVVETNLHILGAKLSTYQQRYQQQIPGDQAWSPVLPAARGVFQKHGFDPTAAAGNQGEAQTPKFNVGDSVMYQGRAHRVTGVDPQSGKLTLAP